MLPTTEPLIAPTESTRTVGPESGVASFAVEPQFDLRQLQPTLTDKIEQDHLYTLPEIIHLAQQNNPLTRMAWLEAEQAALATGMVKATYLPMLSASVVGGYQRSKRNTDIEVGPLDIDSTTNSSIRGVVPSVNVKWLLFDFGKRAALHEAATEIALASQVKFNATHQAIIFNVSRMFFEYSAARQKSAVAKSHLANSKALEVAAKERFKAGVGTSIEVAQASQLTAQANLRWVQSQGAVRDSYQAILSAAGLAPTTTIQIADAQDRELPRFDDLPDDGVLQDALAYRPDLIATDAARRAAEKGIDSVRAEFLPTVALMGVASAGTVNFNVRGVGDTSPQSSSTAVLLGVSIPIFDGGLRQMRLREAEARAATARELVRKSQNDALREMHFAVNALRSALEAYEATTQLVSAAQLTHHAAVDSYKVGLGSMMLATESANGLLDARQAQTMAYTAALVTSANLAFMMGQLTEAPPH